MSNRVDFFQSAQTQLSLPAAEVSVLLDGMLCSVLEPIEIVRSDWPEFSWARLAYNPAMHPQAELMTVEEVEDKISIGKSICIRQIYNNSAPGVSACSFSIFVGQIEGVESKCDPDGERIEVVARDFSANLKRETVYGRQVSNLDGSVLFLAGVDTVFNEDGKANAQPEPTEYNGRSYTMFCPKTSEAKLWSYAEIINYLLCEHLPDGQLHTPDIERLRALTGNLTVRDLDVTGLNLLEALHRCCDRVGLRFKFVSRLVEDGSGQAIMFYRSDAGREIELNCQPAGEQLSVSKTNILKLQSKKNFWPITHKYIGQGDFKVYEATFELVKAWDQSLEDTDYNKFSPSTNPDFYQVKDVYRKWCLNEAGDYSGQPYNQGGAFDFSKIFQSGNFVCCRRRFWPTLTTDKQGKSLGYFLQVSFDNGSIWLQYLYAFNNLLDECGIWLSSDQLDIDTWMAALKGSLKFRITASVISDERLSCAVANGPVNSAVPVVEHIITLPRQFKYRKVSGQSIFANVCDDALGVPDEVDDSTALLGFIRQKACSSAEVIGSVNVQMPSLMFDYRIGDRVGTSPESRDLFSVRSDNRTISWIKRVQMDFRNQCTNLKIVRQRDKRL